MENQIVVNYTDKICNLNKISIVVSLKLLKCYRIKEALKKQIKFILSHKKVGLPTLGKTIKMCKNPLKKPGRTP